MQARQSLSSAFVVWHGMGCTPPIAADAADVGREGFPTGDAEPDGMNGRATDDEPTGRIGRDADSARISYGSARGATLAADRGRTPIVCGVGRTSACEVTGRFSSIRNSLHPGRPPCIAALGTAAHCMRMRAGVRACRRVCERAGRRAGGWAGGQGSMRAHRRAGWQAVCGRTG